MKFAIVGAGATGGYIAARLHESGQEVAVLARGVHLKAILERGLCLRSREGETIARVFASDDPSKIGPADVAILTVKAHSLPEVAPRLRPLLAEETAIVAAQNGIPWWYFENEPGPLKGLRLETVDPAGVIASALEFRRIIGCVIYCATQVAEPGVILHVEGNRFAVGEPDGSRSERCRKISEAFQRAGMKCPVRSRIRHDIWVKLIGNLAFNPISTLTRATLDQMIEDPRIGALSRAVMLEGAAVAGALGLKLEISIEQRLGGAARIGAHKTSMLQDLEAGRSLELDSLVGSLVELADKLGVPVPHMRTLYACAKLLEKTIR